MNTGFRLLSRKCKNLKDDWKILKLGNISAIDLAPLVTAISLSWIREKGFGSGLGGVLGLWCREHGLESLLRALTV